MKLRNLVLSVLAYACTFLSSHAQVILSDSFNGTSVNSLIWQIGTPFADSSVTEGGGVVTLTSRGTLLTNVTIPTAFTLTGQFSITGANNDQFTIRTRTDGVSTLNSAEFNQGLSFQFANQINGSTNNNVQITMFTGNLIATAQVVTTFPINIGQNYNYEITDDGLTTDLYLNNMATPLLSLSYGGTFGNDIGFYNRELGGDTVEMSNVEVIAGAVPEPSTYGLLFATFALATTTIIKRRK